MADGPIQVAMNKFSTLVPAVIAGEPQRVTRRGRPSQFRLPRLEEDPPPESSQYGTLGPAISERSDL